ncbi:MAG: hypothetical protein FJ278_22230 [Planctomycetes bacterium]|nr:hypothetical protein [Planctomycetota bacterium]
MRRPILDFGFRILDCLALPLLLYGLSAAADAPKSYALIVTGISGDADHYRKFWTLTSQLHGTLKSRFGYTDERIYCLFEDKGSKPGLVRETSHKKHILRVLDDLKGKMQAQDRLFVFVIGHADYDGEHASIHLPGPDMRDAELAAALDALPTPRILAAVTTPNSGYFLKHLSKPGRIVITATKPGKELSETIFPYCFVEALRDNATDADGDGRLSVKELFRATRARVEAFYKEKDLISTEHCLLDDNGDGIGTRELDENAADGEVASKTYFELVLGG